MTGAEIIILNVIDANYLNAIPQVEVRESVDEELRNDMQNALKKFEETIETNQCGGTCKNINFKVLLKEGNPSEVILKTIDDEEIDQVVMGKSGKPGIEKFLLGRTTDKIVKESKVPVNVIS